MAFESIKQPKGYASDGKLYATSIKEGESLEAYVLSIGNRVDKETQKQMLSLYLLVDGKVIFFFPAGDINYAIKDNRLTVGANTRFTRLEDTKIKGMKSSAFDIQVDKEDTVNPLDYLKPYVPEERVPSFGGNAAAAPTGVAKTAAQKKTAAIIDKMKRLDGNN